MAVRDKVEPDPPLPLINPKIVEAGDEQPDFDGCLSFPGLYGETVRPHYLRVVGLYKNGRAFDRAFEGFDAVVVHHELDHLDGVLFIDRVKRIQLAFTLSASTSVEAKNIQRRGHLCGDLQRQHPHRCAGRYRDGAPRIS